MADENEELSIDFYNYVSNIIGTEKVVKKWWAIYTSIDCVILEYEMLWISSDSKVEFRDLKGSDVDLILSRNDIRVFEDENKVFPS